MANRDLRAVNNTLSVQSREAKNVTELQIAMFPALLFWSTNVGSGYCDNTTVEPAVGMRTWKSQRERSTLNQGTEESLSLVITTEDNHFIRWSRQGN